MFAYLREGAAGAGGVGLAVDARAVDGDAEDSAGSGNRDVRLCLSGAGSGDRDARLCLRGAGGCSRGWAA